MHERDHRDGHAPMSRRRKRARFIAILLILVAVGGYFLWAAVFPRASTTAEEHLAEIEAARAIPDSENAATIYNELLQDPNAMEVLSDCPAEFVEPSMLLRIRREPWLDRDHPLLLDWVKEHQYVIDRLLEAARLKECRFAISIDIIMPASEMDRQKAMREWGFLLAIAANNDFAEGRSEDAMTKWRCLLRMGSHLRQHPTTLEYLIGSAVTSMVWERVARFIVAGGATESCLQEIGTLELTVEEDWARQRAAILLIEDLQMQKLKESAGPVGRLGYNVASLLMKGKTDSVRDGYMKSLEDYVNERRCAIRGIRILVAMKRYKTIAGHWPHSLDEIKLSPATEILTDPLNGGPFVYRPTGSTFVLYSKGKNNIDEHGKRDPDNGPDDWPIWPPRDRSPSPKPPDANGV
jgi:hypothetical protein